MIRRRFLKGLIAALGADSGTTVLLSRERASVREQNMPVSRLSTTVETGVHLEQPDYEALLAQHDIVYLSPADRAVEGLPVGDGDTTALVWMPPQGLTVTVNKSNLWDDMPSDYPNDWFWNPAWE